MVSMVTLPQTRSSEQSKRPVFIEFTPEYAKEHGSSRDIDRKSERMPRKDMLNNNEHMMMASMSPKDALGWLAVGKAVVELLLFGYDEIVKRYGKQQADMAQAAVMMTMAEAANNNSPDDVCDNNIDKADNGSFVAVA